MSASAGDAPRPDAVIAPTVRACVDRAIRRVRWHRALDGAALFALAGCGALAGSRLVTLFGWAAPMSGDAISLVCFGAPTIGALWFALRRVDRIATAQRLDVACDTVGRLATALELERLGATRDFERAAVADAERAASSVDPRRAVPFRTPITLPFLAVATAATVTLFALRRTDATPAAPTNAGGVAAPRPRFVSADVLDATRSELARSTGDGELVRELAEIVEALERRTIERGEALDRLARLIERIEAERDANMQDRKALARLAEEVGRAVNGADRDPSPTASAAAMRALARAMEDDAVGARERERIQRSLTEALRRDQARTRRDLDEAHHARDRAVARDRATRERGDRPTTAEANERRAAERRVAASEASRGRLSRLRESLDRAAGAMSQSDRGHAAEELERAADELERRDRAHRRDDTTRVASAATTLRDSLRAGAAPNGGTRADSLSQFAERAAGRESDAARDTADRADGPPPTDADDRSPNPSRGDASSGQVASGQPPTTGQPSNGQPSTGQPSNGQASATGQPSNGQASATGQPSTGQPSNGQASATGQPSTGQPSNGQASATGDPRTGGGTSASTSSHSSSQSAAQLSPSDPASAAGARGQSDAPGGTSEGRAPGTGHTDPFGEATEALAANHASVRVNGGVSRGPSRSEIIRTAGERGFSAAPYERVWTDYRDHAESDLDRDDVPPGYRFYVRRYFQLIRPRDHVDDR